MGEQADMMLDGTLCQACGEYIGSDFPDYCSDCKKDVDELIKESKTQKLNKKKKLKKKQVVFTANQVDTLVHLIDSEIGRLKLLQEDATYDEYLKINTLTQIMEKLK